MWLVAVLDMPNKRKNDRHQNALLDADEYDGRRGEDCEIKLTRLSRKIDRRPFTSTMRPRS